MEYDSLIFDLDGTLWDPTESLYKALRLSMEEMKLEKENYISYEKLKSVLGIENATVGNNLFPNLEEEKKKKLMECWNDKILQVLKSEGGKLYSNVKDTIEELSKRYSLYIVSNSQKGYIETFLEFYGLGEYFKDSECNGNTGLNKMENIKLLVKRNKLEKAAYVGDTQIDSDGAREAKVGFIYASYGFGVRQYDYILKEVADLLKI